MSVDAYKLRSRKRSLRVEEHVGTVKFWAQEGSLKVNVFYLLAEMKIWYLALGTKDKITYPLADMQTRYMALGEKAKSHVRWRICKYGAFQCRIRDPSGPQIRLFKRAPVPLPTLFDRPRERYTRSSTTSRYLPEQALPYFIRHHATSRCVNCSQLLYEDLLLFLSPRFRPRLICCL